MDIPRVTVTLCGRRTTIVLINMHKIRLHPVVRLLNVVHSRLIGVNLVFKQLNS